MGVQDRDWHREWWAKKEGYVEKARFRLPDPKPKKQYHPVFYVLGVLVLFLFFAVGWRIFRR